MILWMLVVHISLNYGHITYGQSFSSFSIFSWLSFFMVPFYFFSGYLFRSESDFKDFLWRKECSLLFPYIIYLLFGAIIYELYKVARFSCLDHTIFYGLLPSGMPFYNTPLWFLVSLFFVNVSYYWIKKLPSPVKNLIIIVFFFYAWYAEGKGYPQVLMHRSFFPGIVYFHFGYILRRNEEIIPRRTLLILACVLYLGINIMDPQCIWFVENYQSSGNYFFNLLFSLSGTYILYCLTQYITKPGKFFGLLGRYSLVIYATHRPLLNYVYEPMILYLFPKISYGVFLSVAILFLLLMAYIVFVMLRKLCPIVVGG